MSRLLLLLLCAMLTSSSAWAQTWHTGRQNTLAWDAVTETTEGDPIPSEELTYEVLVSHPSKAVPTQISPELSALEYTILLPFGGRLYAGVRAVRRYTEDGEAKVARSAIAWSDDPVYVQDEITFGLFWITTTVGASVLGGARLQ